MSKKKEKMVIAYIPVLHEGYRRFLSKYCADKPLYIFGESLIEKFDYLYKEVRALEPELIKRSVEAWGICQEVNILELDRVEKLQVKDLEIIAPKEDVIKDFLKEHFPTVSAQFDDVFLRWDKHNYTSQVEITPDMKVSRAEFDKKMMELALGEARGGSDWWRRVGAVIVKDGKVLFAGASRHVPSAHTPYANGDPRNAAHKGVNLELSTGLHAEAGLIAKAAKEGVSLEGAEIYVTTFPCPPCAKLIAYSGIKKMYYASGYGVLDGESILKSQGVEIVLVAGDFPQEKSLGDTEYKKNKKK
jgi:dCMP deaminase